VTTSVLERPAPVEAEGRASNGGVPARRAMARWAWRLFRREWRQQLMVLALIVVAVAATIVGAAVATNTPPPANSGFGTARDLATFPGSGPQVAAGIAQLQHRFGPVDVIDNQALTVPGSIDTYDLRAQNPQGPYGQPMLSLVSGHYPAGSDQVAMTSGVAASLNLAVGDVWHHAGQNRRVVGIVQNPQSLLDEFALVAPGQVASPSQIKVLFDAPGVDATSLGSNVQASSSAAPGNTINPKTIVLTLATLGMLLIGLVAVGGFTVLAQRRLRSIGMLGALGATDRNIRLVVRANGLVVGVVGTLLGAALGLAAWLVYRPHLEASAHHLIGVMALPWTVIFPAMILAVVTTFVAASRPARSVTKVPIVAALSGRPAPPRPVHRSAVPGAIALGIAFLLLTYSGATNGNGGAALELVLGLVALIVAIILLAPLCIAALASIARSTPIAVRLALRDLSRFRSRSGSALAAISLGVLIAVIICVAAAARYGNVLDYVGPNLASNQLIVYTPDGSMGGGPNPAGPVSTTTPAETQAMAASARNLATALGSTGPIQLEQTSATLLHAAVGRNFGGQVYVATPQLLRAFGINSADVDPNADVLTMRPGLASLTGMQLLYSDPSKGTTVIPGGGPGPGAGGGTLHDGPPTSFPCPIGSCMANPKIVTASALPSGTSAPNTVITEHAVHHLGLQVVTAGWLIQAPNPLTTTQITSARQASAEAGLTLETKNDQPTSAEIINWATAFGILLALGILAMTVGLIRSETAGDLRVLTATGAGSSTRRTLTAATAGALALLGAVIGTVAGYVAAIAWFRGSTLNGGLSALSSVPTNNLLIILIGMPLLAAAGGWLFAGREPSGIAMQPME